MVAWKVKPWLVGVSFPNSPYGTRSWGHGLGQARLVLGWIQGCFLGQCKVVPWSKNTLGATKGLSWLI